MEYILQTNNLSKVYGTKTVLNDVSIHVPKGLYLRSGGKKRCRENDADAYHLRSDTAKRRKLHTHGKIK